MSRLPEVVAVRRHTSPAEPSDERATRIIGGTWQTPGTSWPTSLPSNGLPRYWDDYLSRLSGIGLNLQTETIGFLDTGIDGGLRESGSAYCPPYLRDSSNNCRLVFTQDMTSRWHANGTDELGDDYTYHGTMTSAIAAGFAGAAAPGRDSNNYAFGQGVAQGARVAMVTFFNRGLPVLACMRTAWGDDLGSLAERVS